MVIDTSALTAVLLSERRAERLVAAIARDSVRAVPAPTLVEATAVMLGRRGSDGAVALDALVARLDLAIVPMSAIAATFARRAYAKYGRGVGWPGILNFGDCLTYGVAMELDEPLLFTGEDFTRTDVRPVEY